MTSKDTRKHKRFLGVPGTLARYLADFAQGNIYVRSGIIITIRV